MATPWNTIAYSGRFGAMIASTSPGPKPARCEPAREPAHAVVELRVREHAATRAVDDGRLVVEVGCPPHHQLGQQNLGDLNIGKGTAMKHGPNATQ